MPPYRSLDARPEQPGSPPPPGPDPRRDDRAYLWLAVAVGVVPLVGAMVCSRWSDTEVGVGTALLALAAPALVRSYRKGT